MKIRLRFLTNLVLSLAASCACFCPHGYAQTIQITAGPAIAATKTSPAWTPGSQYCTGYLQASYTSIVSTAQLSGTLPPQSALQNELYAPMTCTITGLTPGISYQLTWIGAELYWGAKGQRVFSLSANGMTLFTGLDIFAIASGQNIAIQKTYTVTATAAGTLVLTFAATVDEPKFDALILSPSPPAIPTAATASTDTNGTTTIVIPASAKTTMTCTVALAGSTYVTFAPQVP